MKELYAAIHERMSERGVGATDERPALREFVSSLTDLPIDPKGIALDAGCGGTLSLAVACANHGFKQVEAVDVNEKSLRHAQTVAAALEQERIRVCCASVADLPFPDGAFDFIVCSGVAHHTPDPERVVAELARTIKPGGTLYISLYCFAGSVFEGIVRVLRAAGTLIAFRVLHKLFGRSRLVNNFVLDHMYVPILWLYRAAEVREMLARHSFSVQTEWPSAIDPFARAGALGRWISGDGLMRVWVCTKR
jgi:ubiquinone/menaquinone biosynthesis C-methylase UbiE